MSRIRTKNSYIAGTGRWMGLLALVLTATLGWGQSSKLSKDLQAATSTNVDVVIQYYTPPTSVDTNARIPTSSTFRLTANCRVQ